jgi:hypothetical protein
LEEGGGLQRVAGRLAPEKPGRAPAKIAPETLTLDFATETLVIRGVNFGSSSKGAGRVAVRALG